MTQGAYVIPGPPHLAALTDRVLAVPEIVTVEDETVRRRYFPVRWADQGGRPSLDHAVARIIEPVLERGADRAASTPFQRRREGA